MILNIVKNGLNNSEIARHVKHVFDRAEVNIKKDYTVSVDIQVTDENGLYSLEALKELEYHFRDYDIRIW